MFHRASKIRGILGLMNEFHRGRSRTSLLLHSSYIEAVELCIAAAVLRQGEVKMSNRTLPLLVNLVRTF